MLFTHACSHINQHVHYILFYSIITINLQGAVHKLTNIQQLIALESPIENIGIIMHFQQIVLEHFAFLVLKTTSNHSS
jgi:hypothetical protein